MYSAAVSTDEKLQRGSFFAGMFCSLVVLITKFSGLLMFSEIGKLNDKKFLYSSRGVCSKIRMFPVCKLLKNGGKTWAAFLLTSGLQTSSRKWL